MSESNLSTEFLKFLETFAVLLAAARDISRLDLKVNEEVDAIIDGERDDYLKALATKQQAEEALIEWAKKHPEWFAGKKSLSTPHGTVSKRETNSLGVPNEAISVRLIVETFAPGANVTAALGKAADFLHVEISPNLEALEKLDDAELAKLGITRTSTTSYTVKAAGVDLGKAVEAKAKAGEKGAKK